MLIWRELSDKKSPFRFFIKFLLCFLLLYLFFPFYRGITGHGGKIYSPFLDTHLNLVRGFTHFLTSSARYILEAFHYNVHQENYRTLRIEYSPGINVNPSCLGWGVMSFWVAFVYGNSVELKDKLKWIIVGLSSILFLNITRITLIAVANHLRWKTITSLDHHQTFNICSYGCVFLLMFWYISRQKKYEGIINNNGQRQKHALRPI